MLKAASARARSLEDENRQLRREAEVCMCHWVSSEFYRALQQGSFALHTQLCILKEPC